MQKFTYLYISAIILLRILYFGLTSQISISSNFSNIKLLITLLSQDLVVWQTETCFCWFLRHKFDSWQTLNIILQNYALIALHTNNAFLHRGTKKKTNLYKRGGSVKSITTNNHKIVKIFLNKRDFFSYIIFVVCNMGRSQPISFFFNNFCSSSAVWSWLLNRIILWFLYMNLKYYFTLWFKPPY